MRKTYLKVLSESKYCVNTLTSMDSHRPPDGNNNEQKFQEDTEESFFVFFFDKIALNLYLINSCVDNFFWYHVPIALSP